jgi:integrase
VASLTKRTGTKKQWQVRYRDHTGRSRSEQFTRKPDAQTRLREVQTAEDTGRMDVLDAGTATLSEVGVRFFNLHKGEWKANTAKGHAYVWNAAVEGESEYPRAALADMSVRNIRKSHVTEWRNDAVKAGVPTSSVRRALSLISRALDFAADEDMIAANPAARVKAPIEDERSKPSIITPEQVEAIRAEVKDDREKVLISVLAYCGLRPHEARALKASQFGGADCTLSARAVRTARYRRSKPGMRNGTSRSAPQWLTTWRP